MDEYSQVGKLSMVLMVFADGTSPFSLWTGNIGEEPYGFISPTVWEENPDVDGLVILDLD